MADFNISIPKLGESIQEGTITKLFVKEGDFIKEDDILFELATDKVDSEIPSPVSGIIKEVRCSENETYPVGQVIMVVTLGEKQSAETPREAPRKEESQKKEAAIKEPVTKEEPQSEKIELKTAKKNFREPATVEKNEVSSDNQDSSDKASAQALIEEEVPTAEVPGKKEADEADESKILSSFQDKDEENRFYSPLVKNIAEKEGITLEELNSIQGSGIGGRVQKKDLSAYLEEHQRNTKKPMPQTETPASTQPSEEKIPTENKFKISISIGADDTIMKMDRVRKLIAQHMVYSKEVSAHVTSVVEADVTNLVLWRNRIKDQFQSKYNEKISFLPMVTEAVAKALGEFRMINASVDGENIILRKHINIGIAVAREDETLIVPVIKDADTKNILGLTKEINGFGAAARSNKILPDQLQGGTFSITNFGSFKNIIGTPIINQPQVAVLAVGLIEKKPAVVETPTGDAIVVRHKMFLSLTYDHRVIDGMLGGKFLRRVADLLEEFDTKKEI